MKEFLVLVFAVILLSGCAMAGHGGAITRSGGLEATCAGGCSVYKSDGSGCAKFHDSTSQSCSAYFDKLCARNPQQCSN